MHNFSGKWITDDEFCELKSRNMFHKQLEKVELDCSEHRNCHILFRKKFNINDTGNAKIYISADDYYKLYINGKFVAMGPAPAYYFEYNYNVLDVSEYLQKGENTLAVHTLYQGLINRVWLSGDNRHGLILDLTVNDKTVLSSGTDFKVARHTAYSEMGTAGYDTQFLEQYDSNDISVGFEQIDFDDSAWQNAREKQLCDYNLVEQKSKMLSFEEIAPKQIRTEKKSIFFDFGKTYVGYLKLCLRGKKGQSVTVRCAQELNDDGSIRHNLRANCVYEEKWILSGKEDCLDWFDYKSFRYAQIYFENEVELIGCILTSRHYPFTLAANIRESYRGNEKLRAIWDLCVNSQKYGVQEVIQDCMEREKGFYLGDGCYTALTNMVLTKDDSMVRKLIDDAFKTTVITDGMVTCLNCSFMQEIAEYPLMLCSLILWHYKLTGDINYLNSNYEKMVALIEVYRRDYERGGLLCNLDKWCVVEWPKNYQDGYDVDITEGKICEQPHVSINAYYIQAVMVANAVAKIIGKPNYRDENYLLDAFYNAFYDEKSHLFCDGRDTRHISLIGNCFPFAFGLYPDEQFKAEFVKMLKQRKFHNTSLFTAFLVLWGLSKDKNYDLVKELLLDDGAWLRMLRENATTTFEGWGRDSKWNTSLFHLTFTYAAVFLADIDHKKLFEL